MIINRLFTDKRLEQIMLKLKLPAQFNVLSYSEGSVTTEQAKKTTFSAEEEARFEYVARQLLGKDQHFKTYAVETRSAKVKTLAKLVKTYCLIHCLKIPKVEDGAPVMFHNALDDTPAKPASRMMSILRFISEMSEDVVIRRTFTNPIDNDRLAEWSIDETKAEPDIALCLWLARAYDRDGLYAEWLKLEQTAYRQQRMTDSCGIKDDTFLRMLLLYAKLMWLGSKLAHVKTFRKSFPESPVADIRDWFSNVGTGAFDTIKLSLGPDKTSRPLLSLKRPADQKFFWLHGLLTKSELYGPHPSWIGCSFRNKDSDVELEVSNQREILTTQKYDVLWNVLDDKEYANVAESAADIGVALILKLMRFMCNPLQEGRHLYFSDTLKTKLLEFGRVADVEWGSGLPVNFYHSCGEMAFVSWKSITNESLANVVLDEFHRNIECALKSRTMVGSSYETVVKNNLPNSMSVSFEVGGVKYIQHAGKALGSNEFAYKMYILDPMEVSV